MLERVFGATLKFCDLLRGKFVPRITKLQINGFDKFASLLFGHPAQFFKDFGLAHAVNLLF